jgi:hypothetical protein
MIQDGGWRVLNAEARDSRDEARARNGAPNRLGKLPGDPCYDLARTQGNALRGHLGMRQYLSALGRP